MDPLEHSWTDGSPIAQGWGELLRANYKQVASNTIGLRLNRLPVLLA